MADEVKGQVEGTTNGAAAAVPDWFPYRGTPRQVADVLGVSVKLVYRMFHDGTLTGLKVEGAVRIDRDSLEAYVRAHRNKKPPGVCPQGASGPSPEKPTATRRRRRSAGGAVFKYMPR